MRRTASDGSTPSHATAPQFDDAGLDADDRENLLVHTAAIRSLVQHEASNMVQIGLALQAARNCVGRMGFQPYLKAHFPRSQSLASQLMQVATHFHRVELAVLGRFHRGALIMLARVGTPEKARAEALLLIRTGQRKAISKSLAELLIEKHGGARARNCDRKVLATVHRLQNQLGESGGQLLPETLDQLSQDVALVQAQVHDARFCSLESNPELADEAQVLAEHDDQTVPSEDTLEGHASNDLEFDEVPRSGPCPGPNAREPIFSPADRRGESSPGIYGRASRNKPTGSRSLISNTS